MTSLRLLSGFVGAALCSITLLVSTSARAQDPVVAAPAPPALAPPPAAAPATSTSGAYTCVIVERGELSELEARTAAEMICAELVKQKVHTGQYSVSFGRLGSRTRLAISDGVEQREAWLVSLDELQPATARTVEALATNRTVGETQSVDNVLATEATTRRTKSGQLSGGGSLIGATAIGGSAGISAGFALSLQYSASHYAIIAEGRAVGIGSADDKLVEASVGIGGRVFLGDGDVSPFLGAGLEVAYYDLTNQYAGGSGAGAFGEIGVAGLRSSKVGVQASVRAALPFFAVTDSHDYVVPVSLNLGLTFL